jgi:hypothetical protein
MTSSIQARSSPVKQKPFMDDSFQRIEVEDIGGGDQAFISEPDTPIADFVGKGSKGNIKAAAGPKAAASLTPDQIKVKQIIEKMEREGLSFTSFFDSLRSVASNGVI